MHNIQQIEKLYRSFIQAPVTWQEDKHIQIDLKYLFHNNLLKTDRVASFAEMNTFRLIETEEKITLINDMFIVWIVPHEAERSITDIFIALNSTTPHLELSLTSSGVYNNSSLIMKIIEKNLIEIAENETFLSSLEKQIKGT